MANDETPQPTVPNDACTMCGGSGKVNEDEDCPLCDGTGRLDVELPDGRS